MLKPVYFLPAFLLLACASPKTEAEPSKPLDCEYVAGMFTQIPKPEPKIEWTNTEQGPDSGFILRRFNLKTGKLSMLLIVSPHLLSASTFNERFKQVRKDECTMRGLTWEAVELETNAPVKSVGG